MFGVVAEVCFRESNFIDSVLFEFLRQHRIALMLMSFSAFAKDSHEDS